MDIQCSHCFTSRLPPQSSSNQAGKMKTTRIGAEFRIPSPDGASRAMVLYEAPSLLGLYDHPSSNNGHNLLFYTPSTPAYAHVREYWSHFGDNTTLLAILRPRTEAAVQAAVSYLVTRSIPLSVRSGGHGQYDQGRADNGGVVIDMQAMDSVSLAPHKDESRPPYEVVVVGGGISVGNIGRSLHIQGLVSPTAWSSSVGFTGWMCGGGYSFLSAKHGLGVDNLLGARLVTWTGQVVDTDTDTEAELLWALRGAGNGKPGHRHRGPRQGAPRVRIPGRHGCVFPRGRWESPREVPASCQLHTGGSSGCDFGRVDGLVST